MPPERVVLVLGPYRSGTSITARVAADLGVDFGPDDGIIPADSRNPSGYLERDLINEANRAFIDSAGGTLEAPGDPANLRARGDQSILAKIDLAWMQTSRLAGIKDPRMCATLAAWFDAGLIEATRCRVIHVTRDLDATLQSAVRHEQVASYAGRDPARIRLMLQRYADAAQWQVEHVSVPAIHIAYEELLARPVEITDQIARFIGVDRRHRIRRAAANIGREKARSWLRFRLRLRRLRFRLGAWKHALLGRRLP